MRLAIIADVFPPLRSSGAVQLRDLCAQLATQGHEVTMMVPSPTLGTPWKIEQAFGVQIVRLRSPKTKDTNYVRRTIGEFLMPFVMLRNFRKSPICNQHWDGIIWYSPTIFFGPMVKRLKRQSGCKSYLIIRDIFPDWAVDMGLMGRGLPYRFFAAVANYQYSAADVIGIQTEGNSTYFSRWLQQSTGRLEVLQNWLADAPDRACSISVKDSVLAGRKIFVYAGNMGIAQGMGVLLDLAERMRLRLDVGFLFVGRGSDVKNLQAIVNIRKLSNVAFFDEIDPDEISGLYAQCHVGLVALDPRHKSHNIPGKFLTYMQSGLPVIATVNAKNDLADLIRNEKVGCVCEDGNVETLERLALDLISHIEVDSSIKERCKSLYNKRYRPEKAAEQIVAALASRD
jgi:glycosyltransferase involved in cell wall biosynthesis